LLFYFPDRENTYLVSPPDPDWNDAQTLFLHCFFTHCRQQAGSDEYDNPCLRKRHGKAQKSGEENTAERDCKDCSGRDKANHQRCRRYAEERERYSTLSDREVIEQFHVLPAYQE